MPTVRRRVLAFVIIQLLVGAGWLKLISLMENPNDATYVGVYGLLAVALVSLVTQYNNMAIGLVVAGNWLLALFWLKGFVQHVPPLLKHELSYFIVVGVIASAAPVLSCAINALLIPQLIMPPTSESPASRQ